GQCSSLTLGRWSEDRAVELDCRLHVNGPPRIDVARVYIKRNNVMFDGRPAIGCDHCVQKERTCTKINNGSPADAHGTVPRGRSAGEIGLRHRRAYISLPDNGAVHSVERIHIVRFGDRNDHWAARTALDVKRLRVNGAYDRTVEIQVARQVGGSGLREGRIDIKPITRNIVVILANVDLRM